MRVVQLANDYLNTVLYAKLFEVLEKNNIDNIVFVPVGRSNKSKVEGIYVYPCFTQIDRALFYPKQKKIVDGLKHNINLEKVDVIHAHTLFSAGYTACKIKEEYNIPYIVTIRNTDVNLFFNRMPFLRKTGISIMQKADRVIFLSPVYRHSVIENYVPLNLRKQIYEKSLIIPNGISKLFLEQCLKKGRPYLKDDKDIRLIYVGEINRNKNLEETIQAAHILRKRGYKISVTVVGSITNSGCKKLVKKNCIEYYEKCSQEQLLEYYRKADIFVMISHTETFGLVYAEAMSQGLPVLYTKGQGFDGQFKDGEVGYAVSDDDPNDLADKILQTVKEYERISENCVENVSRFDWNKIGERYSKIYRTLIHE